MLRLDNGIHTALDGLSATNRKRLVGVLSITLFLSLVVLRLSSVCGTSYDSESLCTVSLLWLPSVSSFLLLRPSSCSCRVSLLLGLYCTSSPLSFLCGSSARVACHAPSLRLSVVCRSVWVILHLLSERRVPQAILHPFSLILSSFVSLLSSSRPSSFVSFGLIVPSWLVERRIALVM